MLKRWIAGAMLAATCTSACAQAVAYPTKPVTIIVPYATGSGSDIQARLFGQHLSTALSVPVVVENRPGANGAVGLQALKAAPADGTTVFLSHDHTISILPLVVKNPGYEPAKDFVPVAGFATFVNALAVSGGTPAKSVDEYVKWVQTQGGGKGAVGVPAPASVPEFLVKVIGQRYKLDLVAAPYRGSAPMIGDMLGNQIAAGVGSIPDFIDQHKAGKLRVVGVLGGARQAALPDVPTFSELGLKGFEDVPYYGVFAPAGTPKATLDEFSAALQRVIALPDVRERLTGLGLTVGHTSGEQLAARERAYSQTWAKIIKDSGFTPQ